MTRLALTAIIFLGTFFLQAAQPIKDLNEDSWAIATQSGNTDLISQHLEIGVDVNTYDPNNGNTALINAVESGNIEAVKLLVTAGASVNEVVCNPRNEKRCALTSAFRYPEILEYLIDAGADIHIKLNQKKTPLHYAVECVDYFEAVRILLENKANPNAIDLYGRTPLHMGMRNNKIAFALLKHGAKFNIADHEGWKPLHHAYEQADIELLQELVKRGASLREFTPRGGNALHCAIGSITQSKGFNLVKFLIEEQKMDINESARWHDGKTGAPNAFMTAVMAQRALEDDFGILDYLIEKGADVNAKVFCNYGQRTEVLYTVLSWATDQKVPRYVLDWLIERGARLKS